MTFIASQNCLYKTTIQIEMLKSSSLYNLIHFIRFLLLCLWFSTSQSIKYTQSGREDKHTKWKRVRGRGERRGEGERIEERMFIKQDAQKLG
jgi:hypothetical protein